MPYSTYKGNINTNGVIEAERIIVLRTRPFVFNDTMDASKFRIYTVEATEENKALWVSLQSDNGPVDLLVRDQPGFGSYQCYSRRSGMENEFCYIENRSDNVWYIEVEAHEGVDYTLVTYMQNTPPPQPLITTDAPISDRLAEGEIAIYRIDAGAQDDELITTLTNVNAETDLWVIANGPGIASQNRRFESKSGISDRVCLNDNLES